MGPPAATHPSRGKRKKAPPTRETEKYLLELKWIEFYRELQEYHKKHGTTRVPNTVYSPLGSWVTRQREARRSGCSALTPRRISMLDELDFEWSIVKSPVDRSTRVDDQKWSNMYAQLKEYYDEHGTCRVSKSHPPGHPLRNLYNWVEYQRRKFAKGKLVEGRISQLKKLDLCFDPLDHHWEFRIAQLVEFKKAHNHCNVPIRYKTPKGDSQLGRWLSVQRRYYRQHKLSKAQSKCLQEMGVDFEEPQNRFDCAWMEMLQQLKEFKRKHGHCRVPKSNRMTPGSEEAKLAIWVAVQRSYYKTKKLPQDRIEKLDEMGFVWSVVEKGPPAPSDKQEEVWMKNFQTLQALQQESGRFAIPPWVDDENGARKTNPLAAWASRQRQLYASRSIKSKRRKLLNGIGFSWKNQLHQQARRHWNASVERLKAFHAQHGHTYVLEKDDKALWQWTNKQCTCRRRCKLTQEQRRVLESLGFWDPPPEGMEERGSEDFDILDDEDELLGTLDEDYDRLDGEDETSRAGDYSHSDDEDEAYGAEDSEDESDDEGPPKMIHRDETDSDDDSDYDEPLPSSCTKKKSLRKNPEAHVQPLCACKVKKVKGPDPTKPKRVSKVIEDSVEEVALPPSIQARKDAIRLRSFCST
mmetsp:Transcript_15065/g.41664  ORF Transcript_15065/g.41664 Transcript_15065/m.41664 type:complete len:637 (+) Transcript_15065:162-2072(+)